MEKLTAKQIFIGGLLVKYYLENNKAINVYQFIDTFKTELEKEKIDTQKINSVNATLASLATKELVSKEKKQFNEKLITHYSPMEKLEEVLKACSSKSQEEK